MIAMVRVLEDELSEEKEQPSLIAKTIRYGLQNLRNT